MNAVTLQSVDVIMSARTPKQVSTVLVILDTNLCQINELVMILMSAMKLHQYVARFVRTQLAPTSQPLLSEKSHSRWPVLLSHFARTEKCGGTGL